MGDETLCERIKHFLGSVGFDIFIWAYYSGDESKYWRVVEEDLLEKEELGGGFPGYY